MRPHLATLVLCSTLALGALTAHAAAEVEIRFIEPEKFTDVRHNSLSEEALFATLTQHLQTLGQKYLGDAEKLEIEVTDIDLAGRIEYPPRAQPVRVLRNVTGPRITLRWRRASADQGAPMQEVTLHDTAYLARINHYDEGDPLRYEKLMLETWFRGAFVPAK